ncbi:hypothetical protein [Bacillus sp. SM2101]|nr:hypothetical protein [Bacillus sp. SM2101]
MKNNDKKIIPISKRPRRVKLKSSEEVLEELQQKRAEAMDIINNSNKKNT